MIIGVSFSDILKLKEFYGMSEFDLLPRKMDNDVFPYLFKLGSDIDKPVSVQACLHRNVDDQQILGYRYVSYERTDKEWLESGRCSIGARIAACTDPHLAADLYVYSKQGIGESGFKNMCVGVMGKTGTTRKDLNMMMNKDWQLTQSQIQALQDVQRNIRGELSDNENILFE